MMKVTKMSIVIIVFNNKIKMMIQLKIKTKFKISTF